MSENKVTKLITLEGKEAPAFWAMMRIIAFMTRHKLLSVIKLIEMQDTAQQRMGFIDDLTKLRVYCSVTNDYIALCKESEDIAFCDLEVMASELVAKRIKVSDVLEIHRLMDNLDTLLGYR